MTFILKVRQLLTNCHIICGYHKWFENGIKGRYIGLRWPARSYLSGSATRASIKKFLTFDMIDCFLNLSSSGRYFLVWRKSRLQHFFAWSWTSSSVSTSSSISDSICNSVNKLSYSPISSSEYKGKLTISALIADFFRGILILLEYLASGLLYNCSG